MTLDLFCTESTADLTSLIAGHGLRDEGRISSKRKESNGDPELKCQEQY